MGVLVIHALPANVAAIRPHHWAKNLLIFAPIILGQRWASVEAWRSAAVCFLSFSLFASFIYILNDLLDRESDRLHATKRLRPIASGRITRPTAGIIAILLLVGGAVSALSLPQPARLAILAYVVSATVYSTWAKSLPVVDVLLLGSFYTMRVLAGGAATSIRISPWTLAFCMFLFLSIALAKRYVEVERHGPSDRRGYRSEDSRALLALGVGSGLMAVQVLALYIYSPEVRALYARPEILWLMCPVVLYWIAHMWVVAGRGELADDPLIFALRDSSSYVAALFAAGVLLAAKFIER